MSRFDGRIVKISITVCTEFVLKINKNGTRYRERMPFCGYLLLSSAARIFSAAERLPGEYTFHDSSRPLISERRFSRRFLASAAVSGSLSERSGITYGIALSERSENAFVSQVSSRPV